jgi:hypothetical protein
VGSAALSKCAVKNVLGTRAKKVPFKPPTISNAVENVTRNFGLRGKGKDGCVLLSLSSFMYRPSSPILPSVWRRKTTRNCVGRNASYWSDMSALCFVEKCSEASAQQWGGMPENPPPPPREERVLSTNYAQSALISEWLGGGEENNQRFKLRVSEESRDVKETYCSNVRFIRK